MIKMVFNWRKYQLKRINIHVALTKATCIQNHLLQTFCKSNLTLFVCPSHIAANKGVIPCLSFACKYTSKYYNYYITWHAIQIRPKKKITCVSGFMFEKNRIAYRYVRNSLKILFHFWNPIGSNDRNCWHVSSMINVWTKYGCMISSIVMLGLRLKIRVSRKTRNTHTGISFWSNF